MDPNKDKPADGAPAGAPAQAPADALSRTPDDLSEDPAAQAAAAANKPAAGTAEKKISPIKKLFRKLNLYFLIFGLLVIVAGVIAAVNFFNSQKVAPAATVESQSLSTDALKQLSNTDATVGNTSQTLNIQGNAVIAGQTLARGNLNVAGNIQAGGSIQGSTLTIGGAVNLAATQINSLQVATTTALQGTTTMRDVNVAGTSTFSGPMTASAITTTSLTLSGNAKLVVPNHISFTGPSPARSINPAVLGNSGSASINGSDTAGTININSGNNPTAGCFIKITFQQAFSNLPHVVATPIGAAAGALDYYITRDQSGFSVCGNNAAAANQVFAFDYFVTN